LRALASNKITITAVVKEGLDLLVKPSGKSEDLGLPI